MIIDGVDWLNGKATLGPVPLICINRDFSVVGWSRERGLYDVGQGTSLESAIAIVRLHTGSNDYIDFTGPLSIRVPA